MSQPTLAAETTILVSRDRPGTATISLHRPHRHNAWTVPMQRAYFDTLERLVSDPSVRVIVLTGSGGIFCPGADTEALTSYSETGTTNPEMATITHPEWFAATVPKPVIAAIEGMCAGVGLSQALLCDLRIASPDTRFSTAFVRRALPPMHAMSVLLTKAAGDSAASDLLLSGRTFSGVEAASLGVVNEVHETPLKRALDLAEEMASLCAPASLAATKEYLLAPWLERIARAAESAEASLDDVLGSADFAEGVASLVDRRPPVFQPLTQRKKTHS